MSSVSSTSVRSAKQAVAAISRAQNTARRNTAFAGMKAKAKAGLVLAGLPRADLLASRRSGSQAAEAHQSVAHTLAAAASGASQLHEERCVRTRGLVPVWSPPTFVDSVDEDDRNSVGTASSGTVSSLPPLKALAHRRSRPCLSSFERITAGSGQEEEAGSSQEALLFCTAASAAS